MKADAMELPNDIGEIEVYYDGRCGMCCTFQEWLSAQPRAFGVKFMPYQSPDAEKAFPGLAALDPAQEMVVRTSEGGIYRGAEAWVWCLYSCANHQHAARRLAAPALLPVAIRACRLLAAKRRVISKMFFRRKDREVTEALHGVALDDCGDGFCEMK